MIGSALIIISSGYLILTCVIPSNFITCKSILETLIEFLIQNWFKHVHSASGIILVALLLCNSIEHAHI